MKLFLSSAGLVPETRTYFISLLNKKPEKCTAAFIPTAGDPEEDKWFIDAARKELTDIGISVFDIDLKNESKKSLEKKLAGCDVIYVNGGNTFYLLYWARKSGLVDIVKKFLNKGIIYIGTSAGSVLACPTIETAGWKHADRNIVKIKDLNSLNLVDFMITPHFTEACRKITKKESMKTKYPVVALNDKQAIIVKGKSIQIVGDREKVFFNGFHESV